VLGLLATAILISEKRSLYCDREQTEDRLTPKPCFPSEIEILLAKFGSLEKGKSFGVRKILAKGI
jgi:hypothetical protein